jgi:hypothetical protein
MDSAFRLADRMAMLDRGRMLLVADKSTFEALRVFPHERLHELDERRQLIRQFLRGDAEGPITQRRERTNFAEDLLGLEAITVTDSPSVQSTRAR